MQNRTHYVQLFFIKSFIIKVVILCPIKFFFIDTAVICELKTELHAVSTNPFEFKNLFSQEVFRGFSDLLSLYCGMTTHKCILISKSVAMMSNFLQIDKM